MLLALVLLAPLILAGCIGPLAKDDLRVIASAPKEGNGLTLFLTAPPGLLKRDRTAEYEIRYGEQTIYPPGGKGAVFDVEAGSGTAFVPYSLFVVGNGDYDVIVRLDDEEARARVPVEKWVSYVYLHPFDRGSKVVVDAQLSRTTGGLPHDRVVTEGDLHMEIRYRGTDGSEDRVGGAPVKVRTDPSSTFTRVEIPKTSFTAGPGYYSIEPVFHNHQAKGNLWVPKDPTLAHRNPPWNWIWIDR